MITGEIAILFASAAGIGAAAATWVYDRRLAKRLTDLRRDVRRLESLADAYGERLTQTDQAINKLRQPLSPDVYKLFADHVYRGPLFPGVRPDGKSPDLAAPYTGCPADKHPLYAKTGLPNQPVASLRPDRPAPNWRCTKCGQKFYRNRAETPRNTRCPTCKGLDVIE